MKISDILQEAAISPYEKQDVSDLENYLHENCSEALAILDSMPDYPLWRGFRSNNPESQPSFKFDASTGTRKSQNTTNYYTLLMDNSPYMKGYPKRSNSLVASTSFNVAESYGNVYALLPHDGTRFGICPSSDIWNTRISLPKLKIGTIYLNHINYLCSATEMDDGSFEHMVEYTKTYEFADKLPFAVSRVSGGISSEINTQNPEAENYFKPSTFIPYLQERMAPANTGFESGSLKTLALLSWPVEVWFGGPCVAISPKLLRQIKNDL